MPDEVMLTESQKQALEILDRTREEILAGLVMGVAVFTEQADGKHGANISTLENTMAMSGYLNYWAVEQIRRIPSEEEEAA
jgi:hypothetical protein